ncbi:LysR substrate-binding domain-containing protein [Azohydromonas caseinilytica]|uniref:LysR family transcriptional regulator n=1 Tax=Azohydromonas caseinilytica TaxID=2728836 RepID=A0A848F1S5_9BURK|nr:LysR substrate-binding domain-containing protein [Azohydromonas caseinilytica]NML13634.1 LysR family transcriptional regulator [Azohydromonas caseinilytica]
MNRLPHRPLAVGPLRAFEAVARLLSFRAAAQELNLTQSAVSRQIRALEEELGAQLFARGTRHVELTGAGITLQRGVLPLLERLDATVRQIRMARGRKQVSISTFASFASMWLLPRLEAFQREHPDIDIRVSATDHLVDLDDPEIDLALRHARPDTVPPDAQRLFGEVITPVVNAGLLAQSRQGLAPPLESPADLARHTLLEEDDRRASAANLSWRHWLRQHGQPRLEPARWIYLNFTYQQVQAALAGQGVALTRLALVHEPLQRGELVEPFGMAARLPSPWAYWLIPSRAAQPRPELAQLQQWLLAQAAESRRALGEEAAGDAPEAAAARHQFTPAAAS